MDALARRKAAAAAEDLLKQLGIVSLPVDVFEVAKKIGVPVMAKPDTSSGVSGALVKVEDDFAIAYATHIESSGFRRFSVAHELGHLHIPGHAEALLPAGHATHESRAGYRSDSPYEREADEFAANLLMPKPLFRAAMRRAGDGMAAILKLADLCGASRLATAIRYVNLADSEPVAVVVSEGPMLCYAFLSDGLKEFRDIQWPRRNSPLPSVPTAEFNRDSSNVIDRRQADHDTPMGDWFGGDHSAVFSEEIIGLGRYGRTLTILTSDLSVEEEAAEDELEDSWRPRFRR